ncbi:topoisomerase DNA-binding C4 zinc finger domain-containing protein [Patescibacteria group bacterium]|nr:topoisomerase DNA-binding C4 zinc finger domain-containing protein [Patescibacteria group bacterium]
MDFLETDFHKRKFPRRSIKFRNSDNLLIGVNLQKYETFNKRVWELINKNFDKDVLSNIEKGVYKTNLPKNLLEFIKLQIGKITIGRVNAMITDVANEIEKSGTLYEKEYDVALTTAIEAAAKNVQKELVDPFIQSIEKPLQNLHLGDEDDVNQIERELTSVLVGQLENKISEVLNLYIAKERVNLEKELKGTLGISDVKSTLLSFFDNLQVADLFAEAFEMERNRSILDKQEFYIYFGDISFQNTKYPIFYIPVNVTRQDEALLLDFDSQVYINKRALEFIAQEHNVIKGTKGSLKSVSERIIYLAQHNEDLESVLEGVLTEIGNFFDVNGRVNFSSGKEMVAKGASVRISNACYLSLFEKSDEALVNDYEEILQQLDENGGVLADAFNGLLEDFLKKNPEPYNPAIEEEWDSAGTPEKLVSPSPIPLNSEQLQILAAIRKDNCKYLVVEGPPGTGKSHTITAIIFDAILKEKSVLVLSDKKEALDVVEKNITETMNKVRFDKNFQNPILRLGKTGNTYGQILAKSSVENIKIHHRAFKKDHETIEHNIEKSTNSLKEDLEAEIIAYGDINIQEIQELVALENALKGADFVFEVDEMLGDEQSPLELSDLRSTLDRFKKIYNSKGFCKLLASVGVKRDGIKTLAEYDSLLHFLSTASEGISKLREAFKEKVSVICDFLSFSERDLVELRKFIKEYDEQKAFLVGYLFSKQKVAEIDFRFKEALHTTFNSPHRQLRQLKDAVTILEFLAALGKDVNKSLSTDFDYVALVHRILRDQEFSETLAAIIDTAEGVAYFKEFAEKYPQTVELIGISLDKLKTLLENKIVSVDDLLFDKQLRYLGLRQKVLKDFSQVPDLSYALRKRNIEDLVITQVAYLLDGRLIDFYENNRADAETLRNIIKTKQKFPKKEFQKLKEAFPCILAGIRDYAEFIPLEQNMFDLVIIDEASQVSVAQAFPALLRAKKVLILGDKKQFSNIKAAQARSDTNREYLSNLENSFKRNVSTEATQMVRLSKFNIKTSVLEFFEFISNYNTQLIKHFRGYKEIISYSNKFFYQDSLQVMKIRGKAIDDVIKFSYLEPAAAEEVYPNSNMEEVEFIIAELQKIKEENKDLSVGIITPHTNQQKLLVEKINLLPERDYYFDRLSLKIMTFDTCQGEERDIIFYSMVASEHSDKLWGVFIKDLANVDIEEDGQIKAQRLNVGFSRAKECVHFILSKPIDGFTGSIGDALRHYLYTIEEAKKERSVLETDAKSKKEPEVLNWFYQTPFWKDNKDKIEFIPQFEIGKYLKQLDRTYSHPEYKVDFLLVYQDERGKENKIVIEYDGFKEHFKDTEVINAYNYENYYSDGDVYRQKVLESYGYKFLRINRFNVGDNPIATLNERIGRLVKDEPSANPLLHNIHETIEGLQKGDMKECPKCKEVRSMQEFRDLSLITGYGRFCSHCKNIRVVERLATEAAKPAPVLSDLTCPRCNAKMILRNGRKGKFYGCSRFPYCRGTRNT